MKKPTCLILTGIGVLLFVVVLIFVVPWFMDVFQEVQQMTEQQVEYKRGLRQSANEPLTVEQEKLLAQLIEFAGEISDSQSTENLDIVLTHISYLTYLNTHDDASFENYFSYVAAMPTSKHRTVVQTRLTNFIGTEIQTEEQEVWVHYYYVMRNWSKTGKDVSTDRKEFDEHLQTHLVKPLMANAGMDNISTKFVKMGLISTSIIQENEVFHSAWRRRILSFGAQEGYLRNAIATPIEFALMRSFFEDAAAFKKWLSEPFEKVEKVEEVEDSEEE